MHRTLLKTTTACLTALLLAACGGSDGGSSSGGTGGADNGTGGKDNKGGNDGTGGTGGTGGTMQSGDPSISVETEIAAPGLPTTATATADKGAKFSWKLVGQPKGSELSDDDLEDANKATVRFVPQLSGSYELEVTATVDGESATKKVKFDVKGYDVPFTVLHVVPGQPESTAEHVALAVNSGGGKAREIGCRHTTTAAELGNAELPLVRGYTTASYVPQSLDDEARIASFIYSDDNAAMGKVELAHSGTTCDEGPDMPVFADFGTPEETELMPMRFSMDGRRVLGMSKTADDKDQIFTANSWVGTFRPILIGDPSWAPHYGWAADGGVLIQFRNGGNDSDPYRLTHYPDKEDAKDEQTTLMDCTGLAAADAVMPLNQVYTAGDFLIVVKANNVYRLAPDDEGLFDCAIASERNALIAQGAYSVDVAQDGSAIVFDTSNSFGIFVASITEPGDPVQISPDDGTKHLHPRFALGGAQVVWTSVYEYDQKAESPPFEENVVRVFRANADGSHPFVVWQSEASPDDTLYASGGTKRGGCTFALPFGAGSPGFLALTAAGLAALRRRRRG